MSQDTHPETGTCSWCVCPRNLGAKLKSQEVHLGGDVWATLSHVRPLDYMGRVGKGVAKTREGHWPKPACVSLRPHADHTGPAYLCSSLHCPAAHLVAPASQPPSPSLSSEPLTRLSPELPQPPSSQAPRAQLPLQPPADPWPCACHPLGLPRQEGLSEDTTSSLGLRNLRWPCCLQSKSPALHAAHEAHGQASPSSPPCVCVHACVFVGGIICACECRWGV